MKRIAYTTEETFTGGTPEHPETVTCKTDRMIYSTDENFEADYAKARAEAYNGEVAVEDILDPAPTEDEKRDAQIFYTAMMTDTLLEEV